jgi:hypothetical protein
MYFYFRDFEFEVVIKLGKHNVVPNHLSRIDFGEVGGNLDDEVLDAQLFKFKSVPDQLVEIIGFLTTRQASTTYTHTQCFQLVTCSVEYQLIIKYLYKIGADRILLKHVLDHERAMILYGAHEGIVWGTTSKNILCRRCYT